MLGNLIIFGENGLESSISRYYHTGMQDVFVGILFAWGLFLYSYKGYDRSESDKWYERSDNKVGHLACLFAIGAALFPTTPENASEVARIIGKLHFVFAALLFITLAYFALFLFTKTHPDREPEPTRRKKQRNLLYIGCGSVIVLCIVLIAVVKLAIGEASPIIDIKPVFWLESIAVVAFGFAWLVKGETYIPGFPHLGLWRDEEGEG